MAEGNDFDSDFIWLAGYPSLEDENKLEKNALFGKMDISC
jgi:hypothetical protein